MFIACVMLLARSVVHTRQWLMCVQVTELNNEGMNAVTLSASQQVCNNNRTVCRLTNYTV